MNFNSEDDLQASFFDELPLWSAPFGLALLERIPYRRGINVLDIGGGTGFPALEIAERLGADSRVVMVDPWPAACRRLKQKIDYFNIANLEIVNAPAERLDFPSDAFDLIVSNNGLNNVENLDAALKECARTAKPGAEIIFTANLPGTFSEFYDVFGVVLAERGLSEAREMMRRHIFEKRKPIEFMRQAIVNAGFGNFVANEHIFTLRFADGEAFLNHSFVRMAFYSAWVEIPPAEIRAEIFNEIESRLNESALSRRCLTLEVPFAVFSAKKSGKDAV